MSGNSAQGPLALWFLNTRVEIRRGSADAPDGLCVMEHHLPFGDSPPTHVHRNEDEVFHVLEGAVRVRVGARETLALAGDTLVGPKGVPHSYRVESPEGARVLVMTVGPDFEGMVRAFGRPAEAEGRPAAVEVTPEMAEALAQVCLKHNIELVGPPLAA